MSSFFTLPDSQRKRKRADNRTGKPSKRRDVKRDDDQRIRKPRVLQDTRRDESISGSESEDEDEPESEEGSEESSEEDETAADRRIRLAQRYLDRIREEVDETGFDAEDLDKDIIAQRLRQDADEAKGRQFRLIAGSLDFEGAQSTPFRADTQSTTAVAVCNPYVYTASKDKTLIKWELVSPQGINHAQTNGKNRPSSVRRKPKQMAFIRGVKINALSPQQHGHTGAILCLAVSPDGKYVATGGADKKLIIWAAEDLRPLKTFTTHRDAVTGLDFAPNLSNESGFGAQLFSASMDRSLKTYSLAGEDSLAYIETLFGHQDHVVAVSAMAMDQCVSVGARDRSARLWRVVDETQLKFLGDSARNDQYHTGNLDCVAALPPQHFVTGTDSGSISLWSIHKKKALFSIHAAHGVDEPLPLEQVTSEADTEIIQELKKHDRRRPAARAITALAALPGTDIVLSGSWDGYVRVWKLSDDKRMLVPLGTIGGAESAEPSNGSICTNGSHDNSLKFDGHVRGIINSLAVFERRKEITNEFGGKKEGHCQGLCVVAGVGKEPRLGRWLKLHKGQNGAIVFEVRVRADQ